MSHQGLYAMSDGAKRRQLGSTAWIWHSLCQFSAESDTTPNRMEAPSVRVYTRRASGKVRCFFEPLALTALSLAS